jgi:abequosyltransferase
MTFPEISIAIPTYNRAPYLQRCLETVITEIKNYPVEIVISDNASTDTTEHMVAELRQQHHQIRYYRNDENIGFDGNVVAVLARATGAYVWLLGDDDIVLPGSVARILSCIQAKSFSLVYANYAVYDAAVNHVLKQRQIELHEDREFRTAEDAVNVLSVNLTFMSSLIMNRTYIQTIEDLADRMGKGIVQLYIALHVLTRQSSCFIAEPCIGQRSGNVDCDFKKYVQLFVVELNDIFQYSLRLGYSAATVRKAKINTIHMYVLRNLLHAKRTSPDVVRGCYRIFHAYYADTLWYWWCILPITLAPSGVIQLLWRIYRMAGALAGRYAPRV